MRSWINYHSHTHYCDGAAAPEAYVQQAIQKGHPAYGFSSHAPLPFPTNWNISDHRLQDYLSEILALKSKYKDSLQVYLGLEIDFIPGSAGRRQHIVKEIDLDYFIGSIHFVDQFANGQSWNIDTSSEIFERGLKDIFQNDMRRAAVRFWEITRQMVEEDKPDVIGHLDKIKMFNTNNRYFSEKEPWYIDQVELTLKQIKKEGCIVEINTRGYYRYGQPDLYPGAWIIKRLAEENIPLMINSDAHKPEEITEGMVYAARILKEQSIEKLAALYNDRWNEYPFTLEGIKL